MHSIQSVVERTGLTADLIRIWERRYQAVAPDRTASNQRLYSENDIERLSLLKRLTDSGRRIGAVAQLGIDELRSLASVAKRDSHEPLYTTSDIQTLYTQALDCILELETARFSQLLEQAMVTLGSMRFMLEFAGPLLIRVGEMWRSGAVRTCQEHFASAHLRSFLGRYLLEANTDPHGPRILVATLPGQAHELGATMAAVVAAQSGWNVLYLGPSVPIEEIVFAADCKDVRAVAIGLSYPLDDPRVPRLLQELRQKLPTSIHLIAGGVGAAQHRILLEELKAVQTDDLNQLSYQLNRLR